VTGSVVVDAFPERARWYRDGYAVVAVDVIRATTTVVTAAAAGRRCFPVASLEEAKQLRARHPDALLLGEQRGRRPDGFDLNNSPAALALRDDLERPLVLLSSSGTRLIRAAAGAAEVYVACLRNLGAQVAQLAAAPRRVAVIGAGTRGEFREEDQLCCAWIAGGLVDAGFLAADDRTERLVERWRDAPLDAICEGASAEYLRRSGQLADLDFVLEHVDDVDAAFALRGDEVVMVQSETPAAA
jgi:2-phosphosulfolactate phosphatase